jgi:hypothetical protein
MTTDSAQQQETMTQAKPQEEHVWLKRFLGDWESEGEGVNGVESVRALGDLWIVADGQGEMPDGDASATQMTLGFDPDRKRFVGTWVGSMMTYQWVYDGELDASGKVLTLNCEGPAFDGSGKMMPYRDVHEFVSDDHRQLKAYTQNEDGSWKHFMTTDYKRKT